MGNFFRKWRTSLKKVLPNCCCSVAKSCWTLCDSMDCSTPGFPVLHYLPELLKLMYIEWVMSSNHLILCHSLLLLSSIFPSIRDFSNESGFFQWVGSLHQMVKVLELLLQHQSSNEYSGLISYRIDWFDFLAVQGTLNSLLQHHSSKASVLWCSAFFMILSLNPPSYPIALLFWTLSCTEW